MATATTAAKNGKTTTVAAEAAVASDQPVAQIQVKGIDVEAVDIPIVGTSPLLVHRFSEKAKRIMLDAMQGRKSPKEAKNPSEEYEAAFYRFKDGGYGFPVVAFKAATVDAANFYGRDVTKVGLRASIFFEGEVGVDGEQLARIEGEPRMREDVVRVGRGGTDLRYRPIFHEWKTSLKVVYVRSALTRDSLLALIDAAGMGIGVGEWRPQKDGTFGQFKLDPDRHVMTVEL
jgi:hypothetical protein